MKKNFNPRDISLIIGLGNPGKSYADTYHNAGAEALFALSSGTANLFSTPGKHQPFEMHKEGQRTFILPRTFMNASGEAVKSALAYTKTTQDHMLVLHDDADLPLGTFKLQYERGAAGHNGIRSIISSIGGNAFWRVRIGVRTKSAGKSTREKAGVFVLKKISKQNKKILEGVFGEIKKIIIPSD